MDANESNLAHFGNWSIKVSGALMGIRCVYTVAELLLSSYALESFGRTLRDI
jgi:hypothetical protein